MFEITEVTNITKTPRSRTRSMSRAAAAVLLAAGAPLVTALGCAAEGASGARPVPVADSSTEELPAERSQPYLLLELDASRLRLMHGGAVLRDYPLTAIEVGWPTVGFVARGSRPGPRSWWLTGLEPARSCRRLVVLAPEVGAEPTPAEIPPVPEEACPAPGRFRLEDAQGARVDLRGVGASTSALGALAGRFHAARWRVADLFSAAGGETEPRFRLTLASEDAGALYRSMPPRVELFVR